MTDIRFLASEISHSAEKAEEKLITILKTAELNDKCYAYKTRVKSWKKLIQKVEIKKKDTPDYSLNSITDVLGLRIVTLFRQDMIEVIDLILALISHQKSYNPIPFLKNSLKEAIIYTPSVGNDPLLSQIKQKIHSFDLIGDVEEKASAARYSSIHLVAYIDQVLPEDEGEYRIPIEIQIRTVFEDAWGEIDHKFGYQSRTGKTENPIQNPILVERNLLTLKKFVDSCAEYADNIRDLAQGSITEYTYAKQLDTDSLIVKNLEDEGVSKQVIAGYIRIREQRVNAEKDKNSKQAYLNAAEGFSSLYEQINEAEILVSYQAKKLFRYYIKMDEALCRLSIGDFGETTKAQIIYIDLLKEFPAYPVIRFRLGQAFLGLNRFEESRIQLKKCKRNIEKLSKFPEAKRIVKLPNIELKRLEVGLFKFLGLAYWKEAVEVYNRSPRAAKVKSFLEQAYLKTKEGMQIPHLTKQQKASLTNNLLFYALEIVHIKKVNGKNEAFTDPIKGYLTELNESVDLNKCDNVNQLDTLMNGYEYLKDEKRAITIAHRLEKLSLELSLRGKVMEPAVLSRVNKLLDKNNSA